ncbi:MAG: hypothetical protein IJD82_01245 [Clostridia bacterium]|nr:hypothetical protein [Clostridia bacterium]
MKAKRILSALLTLLMLASVFVSVPFHASAAEATVAITATNPAIPADVGQKIDLSGYTVAGLSGSIVWKNGSDTITTFTPAKKGVTVLTATAGNMTKNIYVVAKNANETDYVLYENDFSCTVDDLKNAGWVFVYGASKQIYSYTPTVSDGALHISNPSHDYYRAVLPAWLGDFGDYSITINSNQTNVKDSSRWSSIVYRIENANGKYYPYYHMCVRANTTGSTVEFAERTSADGWNVIYKNSETLNMTVAGKYHELQVNAFENVVEYKIDGKTTLFMTDATAHTKGYIGLNNNYGVMNVDAIRVTLRTEAPERPYVAPVLVNSAENRTETNIANYFSNQAYATVDTVGAILGGSSYPVAVLLDVTGKTLKQADYESYLTQFTEKNIIPQFKMDSTAQVDLLAKAIDATKVPEALVASADPAVVKYARDKKRTVIRTAYDISDVTASSLSEDDIYNYYNIATGAYAQAIILPYDLATKENVAALQEFELAVWAFGERIDSDAKAAWLIASGANAVVTDNWLQVDATQAKVFSALNSLTKTPVWTGHRGYPQKYPENSVSGCLGAIEDGADCVEIDVKLSSDGYVVVMHDNTIDRTTNGTGNIMQMTLEQIKGYKLLKYDNGPVTEESIPTFEEILQALQGKDIKILCEFKSTQAKLAEKCAELIKKYEMEDQVVFICFTPSMLTSIKKYMNTSTGYLLNAPAFAAPDDTVGTLNAYASLQKDTLTYNATMAVNYGNVTYEFLRDANDRGLTLWSWTYGKNDSTNVSKMFLAGMNGMTTDNVGILKNTLKTLSAPAKVMVDTNGTGKYTVTTETYGGKITDISDKAKVTVLDNDGVVEIDSGKLTAKKDGVASFIVSYESSLPNGAKFTLYSQPITVIVGELPELNFVDDTYTAADGILYGVKPDLKVADLLAKIVNAEEVKIYNSKNELVTDMSAIVGNGFVISYREVETVVQLIGDLSGDGVLDTVDYMMLKRNILGTYNLSDVELLAADVDCSGEVEMRDYMMLKRYILGTYNIFA